MATEHLQPVVISFGGEQVQGSVVRASHPDAVISSLKKSGGKHFLRLVNISEIEVETTLTVNGIGMNIQIIGAAKLDILARNRIRLMKFKTALVEIDDRR